MMELLVENGRICVSFADAATLARALGKMGALDDMEAAGLTEVEIEACLEFHRHLVPSKPCGECAKLQIADGLQEADDGPLALCAKHQQQ